MIIKEYITQYTNSKSTEMYSLDSEWSMITNL